jgi:hypothetical protein
MHVLEPTGWCAIVRREHRLVEFSRGRGRTPQQQNEPMIRCSSAYFFVASVSCRGDGWVTLLSSLQCIALRLLGLRSRLAPHRQLPNYLSAVVSRLPKSVEGLGAFKLARPASFWVAVHHDLVRADDLSTAVHHAWNCATALAVPCTANDACRRPSEAATPTTLSLATACIR